eukprot:716030-Prorocentrum_minimum.AAC.3
MSLIARTPYRPHRPLGTRPYLGEERHGLLRPRVGGEVVRDGLDVTARRPVHGAAMAPASVLRVEEPHLVAHRVCEEHRAPEREALAADHALRGANRGADVSPAAVTSRHVTSRERHDAQGSAGALNGLA